MLKAIDDFLDKTTMYRLLIYYLSGLLVIALALCLFGNMSFNAVTLILSTGISVGSCWVINRFFATIFKIPTNHESSIITGLILTLLITPRLGTYNVLFPLAASGLAMASKYLITIRDVHIFNPAALAVVITALGSHQDASWWIGTAAMLPFVLVGGVLVIRKTKREPMVVSFFVAAFLAIALFTGLSHGNVVVSLRQTALTSPVFFLGFVMLTEPLTSPSTKGKQTLFAILVGLLIPPQIHLSSLYTSPELSLIIGNAFAYLISPRVRIFPVLAQKNLITTDIVDFVFKAKKQLAYQPGQYMEWTLPHEHIDERGNRRYFTLASSPTEPTLRLGVKFYDPSSSYKKAMRSMTEKTPIIGAQVAGNFILPKDKKRRLVFIAGGIGITPFRSMTKYLLDTDEHRDVIILYAADSQQDLAYVDVLEQARQRLNINTTYVLARPQTNQSLTAYQKAGYVSIDMIRAGIPDYHDRIFYISGSHQMVAAIQEALKQLKIPRSHIKVDYFPGYA